MGLHCCESGYVLVQIVAMHVCEILVIEKRITCLLNGYFALSFLCVLLFASDHLTFIAGNVVSQTMFVWSDYREDGK